jgi:tetratricopeptide (TPR) repeat protein
MNASSLPSPADLLQSAIAHYQAGKPDAAEAQCRQLLELDPKHAPALHLLGVIAHDVRRFDVAVQLVSRAILLDPTNAQYHLTLGVVLSAMRRLEEAERSVRTALRLQPALPKAHNVLGHVLFARCRPLDAEPAYREALRLKPDFAEAHCSLGFVLYDQRRLEEAEACQREALKLQPGLTIALNGLAMVLSEQRRFAEAHTHWREIQRRHPEDADAHHNRSIALLLTGQLAEGWREYEWRDKTANATSSGRHFKEPRWNGEPLGGKVLLVHAEQGLGDTLQFCRYLPFLKAERVIFEVQPPLKRLLLPLPGPVQLVARGEPLPAFDVQCPLLSLPLIHGTTLDTIPADIPYLSAEPAEIDRWRERLSGLPGLRVGLVWAGGARPRLPWFAAMDKRRSVPLAELAPLGAVSGVSFVSLQKGPASLQAAYPPAGMRLTDYTTELPDMAATAALIANLDLVVSVDTAVAHLAGALVKPVWLLNRVDTDWRWLLDRDDSPWYPTLRQFRQGAGGWPPTIERVREALQRLTDGDVSQLEPPRPAVATRESVPELFQRALREHQAGRLRPSELACRRVLEADPQHHEALHLAAVIARQLGRLEEAADCARRAIAVAGGNADYHRLLALILVDGGRPAEAETSLRTALQLKPDFAEAYNGLGVALLSRGRYAEAEANLRKALRLRPDLADAHNNLAIALQSSGRHLEAIESCEKALELRPDLHDAYNTKGSALFSLGKVPEAGEMYRRALELQPDFASAHNNLGNALTSLRHYAEAETCYRTALRINPRFWGALAALSRIVMTLGRAEEAEAGLRQVLRHRPPDPATLTHLGNALFNLNRYDEAEAAYREALKMDPNYVDAIGNLGRVLSTVDRNEEGDACYRSVIARHPEQVDAHANRGMTLLRMGRFKEGWDEYEWRWKTWYLSKMARNFPVPLWQGEPLGDRILLLHGEQGLGDSLQFCRYATQLRGAGRVILEVPVPLARLMSRLDGVSEVIARDQPLPHFDLECPLLSLPRAFGTTLETIPAEVPYLTADPAEAAAWRDRLAALPGLRVGLVWAGSPRALVPELASIDARRSISLATLSPLAEVAGVSFVSLQKGPPAAQAATPPAGMVLTDVTAELHDMAATAALIDGLDLVISVDTAVVHLAGAMGKPVWLMNRYDTCWRWLMHRDDSPWYPTMRIFRQTIPGEWTDVIARVKDALEERARSSTNG